MKKNKVKPKKVVVPPTATEKPKKTLGSKVGIKIQIPTENLQSKSLFISTPMYGGQCYGSYTRALTGLVALLKDLKIQHNIHFLFNESLIQRGRNYCCDEFMRARVGPEPPEGVEDTRPYYTHMLFIDSDIEFDPRDIVMMLGLSDIGSDRDVICAPYPKKTISWEKIKSAVDQGFAENDPNELARFVGDYVFNPKEGINIPLNNIAEILEAGTGFMLIQRGAFEKFRNKFPNQSYRPDHVRTKQFDGSRQIYAYFDCVIDRGYTFDDIKDLMTKAASGEDVKELAQHYLKVEETSSRRYLSEDYMFCQYLQKAGGKVWLVPWVKTSHTGTYVFSGSVIDLAQIGASVTADPSKLGGKNK